MQESVVTYNVFHHVAWGTTISIYFWLVGASAGAFVVSSFGWVFGIKRYKPIAQLSVWTAIFLVAMVPVLLIWDLGKPIRFIYLLMPGYWHSTGPMSWGTVLISIYPLSMMTFSYMVWKQDNRLARVFGIAGIVLALCLEIYTAVVMELNPGRFLNHTALATPLFLIGAFISGIAMMIMIVAFWNVLAPKEKRFDWALVIEMGQYMKYGLILDIFLLFLEFIQSIYGGINVVIGHEEVLMGVFKVPYFWLEIVFGLVLPFIMLVSPLRNTRSGVILASLMVASGVYGMRVWWVMGGQYLQTFF